MGNSLRVLYYSSFGEYHGGGQRSLDLLIQGMMGQGVTPIVAAPEEGALLASLAKRGVTTRVIPLPPLRSVRIDRITSTIRHIRNMLEELEVDLVHTDGPRSTHFMGRAVRPLRIPLVFHIRVSTPEPWMLDRLLASRADALICVSSGAAERFRRFQPGKIHMIPNGVDLEQFHPGMSPDPTIADLRVNGDEIVIGEIGFISPAKGQAVLLEAAAAVPEETRLRIRLVFVGDGEQDYLDRLIQKVDESGLSPQVLWVGPVSDVRPILAGLDIAVLPSESEGLPRALIESAAMELPLIASDIPGCRDVVEAGENGYLCPAGDIPSWTEAIMRMITAADRTAMGVRSREIVTERFDAEMVTQRIRKLYDNLIRRKT
ncbi:glycosyltransferase [Candidatus Zixiibacteriota bacterium]